MDQRTIRILFALLRSAVCGEKLAEKERSEYLPMMLQDLISISAKHNLSHLLVYALKQNNLLSKENVELERFILEAVYRCEQHQYELEILCSALEKAKIPFLPLKGSVIRKYYPQEWMRTSCDIDILVHSEDLEKAVSYLTENLKYVEKGRSSHDISLYSPTEIHVELHYDLVEEERANNAIDVLQSVWSNVALHSDSEYWYEMSDEMFYFYHIAHMAKHFENGGCGIRPFIDLWILDNIQIVDIKKRAELLAQGNLLKFENVAHKLSRIWFSNELHDFVSKQMEDYIMRGGVYGSTENRIDVQQQKKGGRLQYVLSKIFIPYDVIKFHYPILHKHRWLTPFMEIHRWCKLFFGGHAKRMLNELKYNHRISADRAAATKEFLENIGL